VTVQASTPGEREHPALALVNSRHNSRSGPVDHLATPEDLGEWLAWRALATRGGAGEAVLGGPVVGGQREAAPSGPERTVSAALRRAAPSEADVAAASPRDATPTDADLAAVRSLRAAVRELLVAAIERRAPEPGALAIVNRAAAAAPAADQLRWDAVAGPLRTRVAAEAGELERAIAALAEDAIRLVTEHRDDLIACQAPGCVRILLKDHPRRQWCSTRCGDRVRAARHYRRARERAHG
jgi:predicted RNA-binding Zn ribbon-like protein